MLDCLWACWIGHCYLYQWSLVELCGVEDARTEGEEYPYPSESYAQTGVCDIPYHRVKQKQDCSAGPTDIFWWCRRDNQGCY